MLRQIFVNAPYFVSILNIKLSLVTGASCVIKKTLTYSLKSLTISFMRRQHIRTIKSEMHQVPTSAHIEAKRFFAVSTAVKFLPSEQFSSVVDGDFVPNHWSVPIESVAVYYLRREKQLST